MVMDSSSSTLHDSAGDETVTGGGQGFGQLVDFGDGPVLHAGKVAQRYGCYLHDFLPRPPKNLRPGYEFAFGGVPVTPCHTRCSRLLPCNAPLHLHTPRPLTTTQTRVATCATCDRDAGGGNH